MTYRQCASQFVQLSPESTNPLLSNATRFPYFVRDVPPDTFQGVALASLMDRFVTQFIQRGLMSATTKSFALVHADDAYSAGIAGVFLAALPATQVRVGVEVTIAMAVYSALPPAQKATWLTQLLRAVCDSADYVVVALLPQSYTQAVLAAGQQACNMTGSRWVLLRILLLPPPLLRLLLLMLLALFLRAQLRCGIVMDSCSCVQVLLGCW